MLETGTPRTPFSEINGQTVHGADPAVVGLQARQGFVKPGGNRRSWAPDGLLQRFVHCSLEETQLWT